MDPSDDGNETFQVVPPAGTRHEPGRLPVEAPAPISPARVLFQAPHLPACQDSSLQGTQAPLLGLDCPSSVTVSATWQAKTIAHPTAPPPTNPTHPTLHRDPTYLIHFARAIG